MPPEYETYPAPPDYVSPSGRQYDTVRADGTVPAPCAASYPEPPQDYWLEQPNQTKFSNLRDRIDRLEGEVIILRNAFKHHAHAPGGQTMVQYN